VSEYHLTVVGTTSRHLGNATPNKFGFGIPNLSQDVATAEFDPIPQTTTISVVAGEIVSISTIGI
jgi:hypothetical protein